MEELKHSQIVIGGLFIGGLASTYLAADNSNGILFLVALVLFIISGFLAGQQSAYDRYKHLHYSILESEAKKRREEDEKLSRKVHQHMIEYEKEKSKN